MARRESASLKPGAVRGAYGLALPSLPGQQWLNPAAATWPAWTFVERADAYDRDGSEGELAVVRSASGRSEHIDLEAATTTLSGGEPLPPEAFVHPVLPATAAAYAEWSGKLTFHGGAFLDGEGGVWGLLGDREQGKSSALTWLMAAGHEAFADDLLITDGETVYAGPRCLDLREASARHFGLGVALGPLGLRRRWRVDLPAVPPEATLRGWVVLRWERRTSIDTVPRHQRAEHLVQGLALPRPEQHPLTWVGALARPMYVLSRPQSWGAADGAMELLLENVP